MLPSLGGKLSILFCNGTVLRRVNFFLVPHLFAVDPTMCRLDAVTVLPACCRRKTAMRSITKRSVVIAGHKTSVSLEDAFWHALKEVAAQRDMTLSELIGAVDADREHGNLSSAIRLFVLDVYLGQLDRILVAQKESKRPRGVAR